MPDVIKIWYDSTETTGRTIAPSSTNQLVATLDYVGAAGGGTFDGANAVHHIRIETGARIAGQKATIKLYTADGKAFDLDIVDVSVKVGQAGGGILFGSMEKEDLSGYRKLIFDPPANANDQADWVFGHKVPTLQLKVQVRRL